MKTIYDLKPLFQNLLRPIAKQLAQRKITANQVTLFACLLSLIMGYLLWAHPFDSLYLLLLPVFLFVRMALNAIDGMLAREHNMKSKLGGILNELTDVISDTALYLPFAFMFQEAFLLILAFVILSILTEFAGVVAVQIGASRRYDGPLGKSDRAFVFGLMGLLMGLGVDLAPYSVAIGNVLNILVIYTIINRCKKALGEAQ